MFQRQEQDKTPGEEQNEVELGNLPDKDSLVMIIKMLNKLRRRIEEHSEV